MYLKSRIQSFDTRVLAKNPTTTPHHQGRFILTNKSILPILLCQQKEGSYLPSIKLKSDTKIKQSHFNIME